MLLIAFIFMLVATLGMMASCYHLIRENRALRAERNRRLRKKERFRDRKALQEERFRDLHVVLSRERQKNRDLRRQLDNAHKNLALILSSEADKNVQLRVVSMIRPGLPAYLSVQETPKEQSKSSITE